MITEVCCNCNQKQNAQTVVHEKKNLTQLLKNNE